MKIILNNFGPIAKFEFDLDKDLSLIFGKNNIGKSYAISCLYLILKHLINQGNTYLRIGLRNDPEVFERFFSFRNVGLKPEYADVFDKKLDQLRRETDLEEIELTSEFESLVVTSINESFSDKLAKSFNNSFASIKDLKNFYAKSNPTIKIITPDISINFELKDSRVVADSVELRKKIFLRKVKKQLRTPYVTDNFIRIYTTTQLIRTSQKLIKERNTARDNMPLRNIYSSLVSRAEFIFISFSQDVGFLFQNVYFLPASRSGLYQALSTFSAVIAELSKSRNFISSNSIELPVISEPVSDYFLRLSNIGGNVSDSSIAKVGGQIESEILGGVVSFNRETRKMIFVQNNIGVQWDLSVTSSMISEIAPIVAYLKFIVQEEPAGYHRKIKNESIQSDEVPILPYNLIFIEEPEAHLHPEIQVKLMILFARLVKNNVKIIMTTHSNYMFNKLNNLILDNTVNFNTVGSYLMKKGPHGSVADTMTMKAVEYGIEDENFADVAENLYNERIELYDKINER